MRDAVTVTKEQRLRQSVTNSPSTLQSLAARLCAARSVLILTGAGVSAESGLATFRDAMTGMWSRFRPEDLATPDAFRRQPELVWQWYRWRRQQAAQAQPNAGHRALARLQSLLHEVLIVTQNVDGLHQRAGSRGVLELHGSLLRDRCSGSGCSVELPCRDAPEPPSCPECGEMMRPAVVWFGESLPENTLLRAYDYASQCDLCFSIGTSSQVFPAAQIAMIAVRAGAGIVEINPSVTPLTPHAEFVINGPSGEVLPGLLRHHERITQSGVIL